MSASLLMILLAVPQTPPDTVVVCASEFREALAPWLEHRRQQGHTVVFVSNSHSAEEIRRKIRAAAQLGRLRFVVLIGDAILSGGEWHNPPPNGRRQDSDPALWARCVPVHRAKAEVNVVWGSPPHIAADSWYADLDDDQTPDLAIGRLTADTPDELKQMVAKILAYERSADFGPWRRRLSFVAGIGGFGALADKVIEAAVRQLLTQGIPPDYRTSITYGSWRSPYCPDPRLFHATTLRRLNEGSWFWVYIGHGLHTRLDRVRVPGARHHILANADVAKLKCEHGAPIALFLACYTGAFDARTDCLAERMLQQPDGPVAVVASSRMTMPYGTSLFATALMDQCFQHRRTTLGEAVLYAKRSMTQPRRDGDRQRAMLDALAAAISPAPQKLAAERAEHVLMINLIGDPLLRLRYPKAIELKVPPNATAGKPLPVAGNSPVDGRGRIELVVRRGRLTFQPPARNEYPQTSDGLAAFQDVYRRANDDRLESIELTIRNGRFEAQLDVPEAARGTCWVRVFVEGTGDFASGAAAVTINPAPAKR